MSLMSFLPRSGDLPPPDRTAFLLDFDGTLVEIAPTPESVKVQAGLLATLRRLRRKCGNAVAVISGRPIDQIDFFLGDVPYAVAGEHGIAIRRSPGAPIQRANLPAVPAAWLKQADELAAKYPGVRIERKKAAVVLHFRGAPDAGPALRHAAEAWVATDPRFHIQEAKMAWEIRPAGIDKGHAVRDLMAAAPFVGRYPVFIGDDVTDEDGIRAAVALGGMGFRIPRDFPDPAAVRAWLAALSGGGDDAWGA
ncbi:trehalose-phosphatase [Novacetimonas pomaceti]|uniref:Trehalose 6-phosphate phosphatase n=1 Tax=Novacetimonas pomaceti TaxID=2021998 RepID=A0A318Q916_9PROT|nr:trehalose-phosphatase [Novacetimonas pomaceti]MBV1835384.1 trehalose-phosphatase [Novacetimonas pomaceti]PYD47076.1 trehalose-phosphatase [Novacetimonas pomaceti]PYD76136.1 trehalose-phosphatase [Novacetimonas pomaceti]